MRELVRTNDPVLVTAIEALLKGADIPHVVLDQNMSVLEGSLGFCRAASWWTRTTSLTRASCCRRPGSGTSFAPMPADDRAGDVTEDAILGGRLRLRQPSGVIGSGTTPSCWRPPARRAPASAWSISVPASAPPDWRWLRASPTPR